MEDTVLFIVGFTMIGYALGAVLAICVSLSHYVIKGRRGDAYAGEYGQHYPRM